MWLAVAYVPAGYPQSGADPLVQAEALIAGGRHAAAANLLQRVQTTNPSARGAYLLGFALIQLYRFEQAESQLRHALESSPNEPDWRHALARTLLEQGKNQAALDELKRALDLADKPEFHYAKAMCALNLGRLDVAEKALEASLGLSPNQPEALYKLGKIQIDRGDYQGGIERLRQAVERNPDHVEARFLLGLAWRHRGNLEAAASAFQAVLERLPGHVGALFNLTSVRARQGRDEEAETLRERFETATALQDQIDFLRAGIRKEPGNAVARLRLAELLLDTGRGQEALEALLAARQLSPTNPAIYHLLARVFALRGNEARARQASQIAQELEGRP